MANQQLEKKAKQQRVEQRAEVCGMGIIGSFTLSHQQNTLLAARFGAVTAAVVGTHTALLSAGLQRFRAVYTPTVQQQYQQVVLAK